MWWIAKKEASEELGQADTTSAIRATATELAIYTYVRTYTLTAQIVDKMCLYLYVLVPYVCKRLNEGGKECIKLFIFRTTYECCNLTSNIVVPETVNDTISRQLPHLQIYRFMSEREKKFVIGKDNSIVSAEFIFFLAHQAISSHPDSFFFCLGKTWKEELAKNR